MPMYEYQCEACGEQFETIRKFSDPPLEICEKCGKGPVRRLVSSPAFQFKGSGWYITDYAKKGGGSSTDSSANDGKGGAAKDGPGSTKSETASTDTSESKTTESKKTETSAKPAASTSSKDSPKD